MKEFNELSAYIQIHKIDTALILKYVRNKSRGYLSVTNHYMSHEPHTHNAATNITRYPREESWIYINIRVASMLLIYIIWTFTHIQLVGVVCVWFVTHIVVRD